MNLNICNHCVTGSQWSDLSTGTIWGFFLVFVITLVAAFWICSSFLTVIFEIPVISPLQKSSLLEMNAWTNACNVTFKIQLRIKDSTKAFSLMFTY